VALIAVRPQRVIDLDGRLGPVVENREGYQGVAW
jgi:hypothetical protein